MSVSHTRRNAPVVYGLHSAVYASLAVCMAWIMAAAWLAFGSDHYLGLQLAIMTFLALAFMGVPLWLAMIQREHGKHAPEKPFAEWAHNEMPTASGPVEAKDAAIMVLLAPASVALGITVTSAIAVLASRGIL